jgi:two-component system response regulator AtoC
MASPEHRILVVDDERNMRRVLQALLGAHGYTVDAAENGDEARGLLKKADPPYDVVVTDLRMPDCDGMELMHTIARRWPDIPVVFITAHGTVDTAVEAMRAGAFDFITKPFDEAELSSIVSKAVAHREANRDRAYEPVDEQTVTGLIAPVPAVTPADALADIIGESDAIKALFSMLRKVAPSPTTVLIRGESGTGKELVARALHRLSDRAHAPFITVNCTAIPENLFESELFGHEKGAFTGAVASRPGRFELAHEGTLFLDEIGELPVPMQVKLLRVLQERVVERVGGLRPIDVDVRLVTATNAPLEQMVADGRFREDLFYRLNVVPLTLPPLRQRRSDVPVLVRGFLKRFRKRLGREVHDISSEAMSALVAFDWPGNIRQLENTVERMVLLAEGPRIELADLPPEVRDAEGPGDLGVDSLREAFEEPLPEGGLKDIVKAHTQQLEREVIRKALVEDQWNVTHTAKRLGISRKGLQLKMKDYDLREREGDSP